MYRNLFLKMPSMQLRTYFMLSSLIYVIFIFCCITSKLSFLMKSILYLLALGGGDFYLAEVCYFFTEA